MYVEKSSSMAATENSKEPSFGKDRCPQQNDTIQTIHAPSEHSVIQFVAAPSKL